MPAFVFVLLPLLVMPLLWYAQTGHWWQWSYRREGFYWTHPRMWDALFSFRQGLLIYTPVFWTTVGGTVLLFRSDRVRAFAALGYLLIMTYVISAWWSWTYGDGLGIRAFIDHYAVLAVIAALGLMRAGALVQRASIVFASLAGLLACAQLYQYEHGIFHRFAMDREKYVFTFLRFDPALRNALGGDVETAPFHPNGMSLVAEGICTMETPDPYWQGGKVEERARVAISGRHVCVLDSTAEHGPVFAVQGSQLVPDRGAHVVVDMKRYEAKAGDSSRALYAISLGAPEEPSRYFSSGLLNPVPGRTDSTWRSIHLELQVPFDVRKNEELRFFVWNIDHQSFLLDDIAVKVYRVNSY